MPVPSPVREKVAAIFAEITPERATRLCTGLADAGVQNSIVSALTTEDEIQPPLASDISHHLSDWHVQAAFIVALHLFPERFTPAEISAGILEFWSHVPLHVATFAALYDEDYDGYVDHIADAIKESKRSTIT